MLEFIYLDLTDLVLRFYCWSYSRGWLDVVYLFVDPSCEWRFSERHRPHKYRLHFQSKHTCSVASPNTFFSSFRGRRIQTCSLLRLPSTLRGVITLSRHHKISNFFNDAILIGPHSHSHSRTGTYHVKKTKEQMNHTSELEFFLSTVVLSTRSLQ